MLSQRIWTHWIAGMIGGGILLSTMGCAPVQPVQTESQNQVTPNESKSTFDSLALQAELMGFADRYAMFLSQALETVKQQELPYQRRETIATDLIYGMSSMYSIAAEPNPEAGLLDMIVIVTMGRLIYQERFDDWGEAAESPLKAFRSAEEEIWGVGRQVLSPDEETELRQLIQVWHQQHPDQTHFVLLRFGDFAAWRQDSVLVQKNQARGMFAAVHDVSDEVEQTRLLAERRMFLASRLPLLSGDFMNLWLSHWIRNPEVTDLRLDVNALVDILERLTVLGETLPEEIATRVSDERKQIIADINNQEKQLGGLLTQAGQVVSDVNALVVNADGFVTHFDPVITAQAARPMDVNRVQTTLDQTSQLVTNLNSLVTNLDKLAVSPDSKAQVSTVVSLVDRIEAIATKLMNYAFFLGIGFVVIVLVVFTAYRSLSQKIAAIGQKK